MIRSRRLSLSLLNAWLVSCEIPHSHPHSHPRYRLRVWRENRLELAAIRDELIAYIDEAHEDARRRIRLGFEDDLSPFNDSAADPAANYPGLLHQVALKGYLGETLATLAVEHWGAHGHTDWVIPAMLFRFHDVEFQHIDAIADRLLAGENYNPDDRKELRPGRTGDDGIAFRINEENTITDFLMLEAKCLDANDQREIKDAHAKLSKAGAKPSGIRELINLLEDYETPVAHAWQEALLRLWRGGYRVAGRHDGVGYACGRIPSKGRRVAWMPATAPHPAYTAARKLEGMEFQFEELATLINTLYRGT